MRNKTVRRPKPLLANPITNGSQPPSSDPCRGSDSSPPPTRLRVGREAGWREPPQPPQLGPQAQHHAAGWRPSSTAAAGGSGPAAEQTAAARRHWCSAEDAGPISAVEKVPGMGDHDPRQRRVSRTPPLAKTPSRQSCEERPLTIRLSRQSCEGRPLVNRHLVPRQRVARGELRGGVVAMASRQSLEAVFASGGIFKGKNGDLGGNRSFYYYS